MRRKIPGAYVLTDVVTGCRIIDMTTPPLPSTARVLGRHLTDGARVWITGRWQTLTDVQHEPSGYFRARTDRGGEVFANSDSYYDAR